MSVLPISHVPSIDPARFAQAEATQQMRQDQAVPQQVQDVDPVENAEEVGFGMVSRGMTRIAAQQQASAARGRDPRQHLLQIVRLSRLKGMNPTFDESFWRTEVGPRADDMLKAARGPGGSVEQLAGDGHEDPFKRYLFLMVARQRTQEEEPAAQTLDDAMERIWTRHELEVESGFNTMVPLYTFVQSTKEWDAFRGIYIDYVVPGEMAQTFKALLDRFGPQRLRPAVEALRKAIAADLASRIICLDTNRWRQEFLDLMDNRRIAGLIASASDFCRDVQRHDPEAETVVGFLGGALDLAAGPNPRKFDALCALLQPEDIIDARLRDRLRAYLNKSLPLWLWSNLDARDVILYPPAHRARP